MKELNAKDIMVDVAFMENVRTLMQHGESVPDYMLSGTLGNFKGLPDIHFWYGSDEVLYACAENFVKACKAECVTATRWYLFFQKGNQRIKKYARKFVKIKILNCKYYRSISK